MSSSSSHVSLVLSPRAGFCVKSSTVDGAVLPPPPSSLVRSAAPGPIAVPQGLKVFVNIAWDVNVPPSPQGSEEAIQRVIDGEDMDLEDNSEGWYIPAIVSNPREDRDKSGNPSLVFDCVYNTIVKARTLRDPEFKSFIVELALQRIETQTGLVLSRDIRMPNIASKGKLLPRTVQVPGSFLLATPSVHPSESSPKAPISAAEQRQQEVPTPGDAKFEDIDDPEEFTTAILAMLKALPSTDTKLDSSQVPSNATGSLDTKMPDKTVDEIHLTTGKAQSKASINMNAKNMTMPSLKWSWTKNNFGRLQVDVHISELTGPLVQSTVLDVEPRRFILSVPGKRVLDIDVALSDADIQARGQALAAEGLETQNPKDNTDHHEKETRSILKLKRERDFDVATAEAEWRAGSETIVIYL